MADGMERNMSENLHFRILRMLVPREEKSMYLCLVTANVDFLSQEYTLYYKVGMGIKKIVALSVFS